MKSYVMTWDEAIALEPELSKFVWCQICQDVFVEIVDCLNKKLSSEEHQRVVSGFGLAPPSVESPEVSKFPYFIILEA